MGWLGGVFDSVQQWLFESVLQPLMFTTGLASLLESGYEASGWLLVGLLQLVVIVAVIGPMQRWWPVEPINDRATIRTDILYTLIHRLGLFRLALFFTVDPLADSLFGALRVAGVSTFQLDGIWPGVTDISWVSLLLYLVVFDFVDYWIHRGQHHFEWWWRLHSLHHAQQQMTMWSDNRNHLLDDLLRDVILVTVAQLIGVAPGGKTSAQLIASAKACGYAHVGWSPAGFLGDELPSEMVSNTALLNKALRDVRSGDILLAHLGIWSRRRACVMATAAHAHGEGGVVRGRSRAEDQGAMGGSRWVARARRAGAGRVPGAGWIH